MPYDRAKRFFYHGMGPEGRFRGWAPFSDYFRYELEAALCLLLLCG